MPHSGYFYPAKEIADKANTSRDYVYKEKGKLKRQRLLLERQSLSVSDGSKSITIVKDKDNVNPSFEEDDIDYLDKNDIMSMYGAFRENMSPSEVIAKFGFRPDISQREYKRFLTMNSRDPFELQKQIASGITEAPPEIQSLIEKSTSQLLTNYEILLLVNFKGTRMYVKKAVLNSDITLPNGIERPICKYCNGPQPGVIFDTRSYQGSFVQKSVLISTCPRCKSIYDKIFIEFNQRS
jgi:RNase P subunit RPR2